MTEFQQKVFAVVKQIPAGRVMTYGQVAQAIGRPNSARAVGNALNTNYDASIPCHRVVRADSSSGGYNRGEKEKLQKLKQEGYDISNFSNTKTV